MPSFYIPKIPLHDPMIDTVEDTINRISLITNRNFDVVKRLLYGQLDSTNIRTGGILLQDLMGGFVPQEDPSVLGTGLNITSSHMGYYDGEAWTTFIKNNGEFFFGGDADNFINWDGTTLLIRGLLSAVSGTFDVIGAGDFPDGAKVIIGKDESGPFIEMDDGDGTRRLELSQDRIEFFTEEKEGHPSIYAGMIQGLYWELEEFNQIPEVRIESPRYTHVIAQDPDYSNKSARSSYVCTSDEHYARLETRNLPEGGDPHTEYFFSGIQVDKNIAIASIHGDVLMPGRLVLHSSSGYDHLRIEREVDQSGPTEEPDIWSGSVDVSIDSSAEALSIVMDGDIDSFMFAKGMTAEVWHVFGDGFNIDGKLTASGTKAAVVETENFGERKLYAVEAPDVRFMEIIEQRIEEGSNFIQIEEMFSETISDYRVHASVQGEGHIEIGRKSAKGFEVFYYGRGDAEASFLVYGRRKEHEAYYMEPFIRKEEEAKKIEGPRLESRSQPSRSDQLLGRDNKEFARAAGITESEVAGIRKSVEVMSMPEGGIGDVE